MGMVGQQLEVFILCSGLVKARYCFISNYFDDIDCFASFTAVFAANLDYAKQLPVSLAAYKAHTERHWGH